MILSISFIIISHIISTLSFPAAALAYPNSHPLTLPVPQSPPASRFRKSPSLSNGPDSAPVQPGDEYYWVDQSINVPGDNIDMDAAGPSDPSSPDSEEHADDAIVEIDGRLHYMPTTNGITHTRRIATVPVSVLGARVLRGPTGFGCILGSPPGFVDRAEDPLEMQGGGSRYPWQTAVEWVNPSFPPQARYPFESEYDEEELEGDMRTNTVATPAFFSSSTPYGLKSMKEPFENALLLTCFTAPQSAPPSLTATSAPVYDPATDVVVAWLEFAPSDPNIDHDTLSILTNLAPSFGLTSAVQEPDQQAVQQYGFGALIFFQLGEVPSMAGEIPRLSRWRLMQLGGRTPSPLKLERAAVVYGPGSSSDPIRRMRDRLRNYGVSDPPVSGIEITGGGRWRDLEIQSEAECVAFGPGEMGDWAARNEEGDASSSELGVQRSAEDVVEKARFWMGQHYLGGAGGSGVGGVEGIVCYEGRAVN